MLLEQLDFIENVRLLHVGLGGLLGLIFGIAAQISRFCLRRAVAGDQTDRASAGAVWLTALAVAILSFFLATQFGFIEFSDHRYLSNDIPVLAILLGGTMFGAGMVLTRGCISRLTVLGASGNIRALSVVVLFAIVAHATLKGVLAPFRVAVGSLTVPSPIGSLAEAPIVAALFVALIFATIFRLVSAGRPRTLHLVLGAIIGLTPVFGWIGTSTLLFDEFDPLPVQSMAFTLPWSDTLFWTIASSAIPAGFGVGMIGGVLLGAFLSAALRGEVAWQGFENSAQTMRYTSGTVLMGIGGALAGGCTVGAGLSGAASLSISALLALGAIASSAYVVSRVLNAQPALVPAE